MTTPVPADLAAALLDRYEIRAVLGRGGMATVYLARDRKHQRDVAVKVLQPELAASIGTDRFLKEIEIVAQLTHPHVLPLYDSGEAGGFVYYVMPHIGGGSLRQQLDSGSMDATRALAIAGPVADALTCAHEVGVLHRDIKPENILFSHGHPVVADFGIAKAISTASEKHLTRTGIPLGTPGYMSPEQAAGFSDLDGRTDVYSLAVIVYEMIVGEIPGRWPSEDAVRTGQFLDAPPAHRARLNAAGATVEGALVHGLAVQQSQRTATPSALLRELRGMDAPRKKYRAEEVREIVKRASEMELRNPTAGAMTIGGIEDIGRDVGIAPELIRSAAGAVAPRRASGSLVPLDPPTHNTFLGAPGQIIYERVVEGELPEADFSMMVAEIRRQSRQTGTVSPLGKSFSWTVTRTVSTGTREIEIAITARAGATRITFSENLRPLATNVFIPILIGTGLLGMSVVGAIVQGKFGLPFGPIMAPIWMGANYLIARKIYQLGHARRVWEASQLVDRLATLASDLIAEAPKLPGGRS